MHLALKIYCQRCPAAEKSFPFGPEAEVYKLEGKIFALFSQTKDVNGKVVERVNLKCEPEQALILRDIFNAVVPGYHMNKKHWNTVLLDGSIPRSELERMLDHSYTLIFESLKNTVKKSLRLRFPEEQLHRA